MSNPIEPLWDQAARAPGTQIDIGRLVACDQCGDDYTDSQVTGGFILNSRASCPRCGERIMRSIPTGRLLHLMQHGLHCPTSMSFADFVRMIRGDNNKIMIQPPHA